MSDLSDLPEPDAIPGAPHPRETLTLFGQAHAQEDFLTAFNSGRLHHGWLITGPKGVGKATLAWQMARFLLANPVEAGGGLFGETVAHDTLDIDPDHPVAHRMRALSEPGLFLLRRGPTDKGDKLAAEIRVDEVRKLKNFFSLSAADGGRRVVIIDAADELNISAANAILKLLEEPPAHTTLMLISHQPARLLPTIRSRCRELRLAPLGPQDMAQALDQAHVCAPPDQSEALTALATGAVGEAIRLLSLDGVALYHDLLMLLGSLPALDRPRLLSIAESCAGKGKEERLNLTLSLTDQMIARLARFGVTGQPPQFLAAPDEVEIMRRLSPDPYHARRWAQAVQEAGDRARHARAVNVDPVSLVLDLFLQLAKAG
jgi:DNA polymerase-3 subunit delta'